MLRELCPRHRRFTAADFHETPTGGCRLLPGVTHELAAWIPHLARELAIVGEGVVQVLADASPAPIPLRTPLTRSNSRDAQTLGKRGGKSTNSTAPRSKPTCRNCGGQVGVAKRSL